jgi:quinol monooxygenase YgiN
MNSTAGERRKTMIRLTIEVKARQGKIQELYQTLHALVPTIRKEEGCRDCHIFQDVEDGEVFSLSVDWGEEADLGHYMRSSSGSALLGAADLLSETARVRVGSDTPWEGIEALKRMRKLESRYDAVKT